MDRGEIWLINHLEPALGVETAKTYPAVIISSDALGVLPWRVVVPIMDWKAQYERAAWMVKMIPSPLNRLAIVSGVDTFQVCCVPTRHLIRKIGEVSEVELNWIVRAVGCVIEHP